MRTPIAVLVVEDEVLVRLDIADYLSGQGFEVHEAAGADQALEIMQTVPNIQLLFTDIDMPGSIGSGTRPLASRAHHRHVRT